MDQPKTQFKVGICQIKQSKEKAENIEYAKQAIEEAVQNGAQLVVLGEYFNTMYNKIWTMKDAESLDDPNAPTVNFLKEISKRLGVYIVAGSIPERGPDEKIFNTCLVLNKSGEIIAQFRKVHLFDIDIPGKITFKESEYLIPGDKIVTFDTEFGLIGLGICYDIRFPELAMLMAKKGVKMIIYPGCFNQTTGPLHWELLLRSRAVDNQVYTIGCATSRFRDDPTMYQSWGHSLCSDPMGKLIASTEEDPAIIYADVDFASVDEIRKQLPYQFQKRKDIYTVQHLSE